MEFPPFQIATLPRIHFGAGALAQLPGFIREFGHEILIVTGSGSFIATPRWGELQARLQEAGITVHHLTVHGEPSPSLIDECVGRWHDQPIDAVVGIGGGSVLDAAKAIAALLPLGHSVMEYLEDVGRGLSYPGPSLPFIAVPTTAGTGSEATKNAVLTLHGEAGYKKSFRHERMVAKIAIVDPQLLESCPPHLMAAQGMDAFTQLLESYVSLRANPFTDALAWSGLEAVAEGFMAAWRGGSSAEAQHGRAAMAYGALLSGITLAQVGLGSVHGLAQPLGSLFAVPHGIACGTMVAQATATNLAALRQHQPESSALAKYARTGRLLSGDAALSDQMACDQLVKVLEQWCAELALPRLGNYGVSERDIPAIVAASRNNSMKSNPVLLHDEEIAEMVRRRL
ncbi:MAG TPA: iron-containing alcohol dehydrogenase [Gammaproteobacteria bacterium]